MAGLEFFQTIMGHIHYEGTMPRIAEALERIAAALEKQNKPITKVKEEGVLHQGYQRLVMESTENVMEAIRIIDSIKPCIIWVEELSRNQKDLLDYDEDAATEGELLQKLNTKIDDLELTVRTHNVLAAMGIKTVQQLTNFTREELLKTRNFGRRALNEVSEVLHEMGLYLRQPGEVAEP
jgi:DNA-directed RNA polymerase alpha subunit